jgi:hypothetical protein
MPPIIPVSRSFDQPTLAKLIEIDALVQRYRALFALFDWSPFDPPAQPTGDPDCKLGVKRSSNQEQPDGSTKEGKRVPLGLWLRQGPRHDP